MFVLKCSREKEAKSRSYLLSSKQNKKWLWTQILRKRALKVIAEGYRGKAIPSTGLLQPKQTGYGRQGQTTP